MEYRIVLLLSGCLGLGLAGLPAGAAGQACSIANGHVIGPEGWVGDSKLLPSAGADGVVGFSAEYNYGIPVSKTVSTDLVCFEGGATSAHILKFRGMAFSRGKRWQPGRLDIESGLVLISTISSFPSSAHDQWLDYAVQLPAGVSRITFRYTANVCADCAMFLELDDFQLEAAAVPVLPTSWSLIKLRRPAN